MDSADFQSICAAARDRAGLADGGAAYQDGSFICEAEAWLYGQLASRWRGHGRIVDAGCFLGASTRALCAGLAGDAGAAHKAVVAIDRFVVADGYVRRELSRLGHALERGESFLDLFLERLGGDLHRVEVRAGNVLRVGRIDAPIELCVIDLAKSAMLNSHVMLQWFPRLVPGAAVLVQQDFFSPFHPWIASAMAPLLPCFELAPRRIGESAVFRLAKPLDPAQLAAAAAREPASAQALRDLDRWQDWLGEDDCRPLRLGRCVAMSANPALRPQARALWERLAAEPPPVLSPRWPRLMQLAGRALGVETAVAA